MSSAAAAVSPASHNDSAGDIENAGLNDHQIEIVKEFRCALLALEGEDAVSEAHWKWIDSTNHFTLKRYLIANKWKVGKALDQLKATLKWRDEFKPDQIDVDQLFLNNPSKKASLRHFGFDKAGCPVIYFTHSKSTEDELEDHIKWAIAGAEYGAKNFIRRGVHYCHLIYDMEGWTMSNTAPISWTAKIQGLLSSHYPETTKVSWVYRQPSIFSVFFALLSPFLDDNMKSKIRMLGSDASPLLEFIEPHQLLVRYGGTAVHPFSGRYSDFKVDADGNITQVPL